MRDENSVENTSPFENEDMSKSWIQSNKSFLIIIAALLLVIVGLIIWIFAEQNRKERALLRQQVHFQEQTDMRMAQQTDDFLQKLMKPLTWAVRHPMMNNNYEQVDQYLSSMVREEDIRLLMVVDNQARIIISSDRRYEGTPFGNRFNREWLGHDEITIHETEEGQLVVTAPVLGLDRRLGTLIMFYEPAYYMIGEDAEADDPQ